MEAIDRYETALQLDPTFIHAYLMIGIVFYEGGYNVEADSMVKFLNEIRSDYTLEERKLITWLEAMLYSDLTGYYKVSREIAEFDADWQWNVGWGAYNLNRLYEAEEWFSQVDYARSFATTWEGYWAYYSTTLHLLDKHEDELSVQKERKRHFPQSRMALVGEVIAHMTLGNVQEALDMKKNIYGPLEGSNPAQGIYWAATEFWVHGYQIEAGELIEETIKWLSERPESERAGHRSTLFDALLFSVFSLGPEAREESAEQTSLRNKRIKQLQQIADEMVQEEPLNEGYLGRLGVLHAELGDQEMASQAFATLGDLKGLFLHGRHLYWQAAIAAHLGQHAQAVVLLYDAQNEGRAFSILFHRDPTWVSMKDHPDFIEFMRPKK